MRRSVLFCALLATTATARPAMDETEKREAALDAAAAAVPDDEVDEPDDGEGDDSPVAAPAQTNAEATFVEEDLTDEDATLDDDGDVQDKGSVAAAKDLPAAKEALQKEALSRDGHLPTPSGLAQDVVFWERVFRDYSPDQCVFHDKDNLTIIYAVKRLPGDTPKQQKKAQHRYLAAMRDAIKHLAEGGEPRNLLETRIVQVTEPRLRYPAYWRYAMDNVRCQRGVDLLPSLARSKQHLKMVKKVLAQNGLPTDLAYLPHLESGYDTMARSRAGARGMWQLMPITARLAGLKVGRGNDFRLNPFKATVAAAQMLRGFFSKTKDWPLAITAYNYGINGMSRAIKLYGNDYMTVRRKHHTRLFGFAAKNYYPSFLAVRNVASATEKSEMAMSHTAHAGL